MFPPHQHLALVHPLQALQLCLQPLRALPLHLVLVELATSFNVAAQIVSKKAGAIQLTTEWCLHFVPQVNPTVKRVLDHGVLLMALVDL